MEEELRVVGNNLKSLELSEEKALEREETYEEQIRQLDTRLKEVVNIEFFRLNRMKEFFIIINQMSLFFFINFNFMLGDLTYYFCFYFFIFY